MMTNTSLHTPCLFRHLSRLVCAVVVVLSANSDTWAQPFVPQPYPPPPLTRYPPQMTVPVSVSPTVQKVSTQDFICDLARRHPLCFIIGEKLASQFIATDTIDERPFQEVIMEANVQGIQRTNTRTSIDFVPNESSLMLKVVLNGLTVNQTLSQVRQAAIQSAGSVEFQVTKQIEFDGSMLRTWTPAAFMKIRQQHLGASTPMSPIPLLGPLANSIVMNAAEQRKPMTEAIAAHRITQAVAPEFNNRLDEVLAKLNRQLSGDVKEWLTRAQIYPSHIATASSDNAGMWGVAFEKSTPSSASSATFQPISTSGRRAKSVPSKILLPVSSSGTGSTGRVSEALSIPFLSESNNIQDRGVLLIHESLIADLAERYELGGKDVPPSLFSAFLSDPGTESQGPSLGSLVLAQEQPVFATITRGEFLLTIRAGFKPVIGPEIPAQEVVFSFRPMLTQSDVVFKPELRSISQVNPQAGGLFGAAGESLVRQAIEQKLKDYTFPRNVNVPRDADKDPLPLRLQSLTLADGWLSIAYEPVVKYQLPVWQSSDASMEAGVQR